MTGSGCARVTELPGTSEKDGKPGRVGGSHAGRGTVLRDKTSESGCLNANEADMRASFLSEGVGVGAAQRWRILLKFSLGFLTLSIFLGGCGADTRKPATQAETKQAAPPVPEEIQLAAASLLGSESQVLAFGDLAKNGKQEFLVANVVPKTPTNNLPGTIVSRAVVVENSDGQCTEVLRRDAPLKNQNGYLGLSPLSPVTASLVQ